MTSTLLASSRDRSSRCPLMESTQDSDDFILPRKWKPIHKLKLSAGWSQGRPVRLLSVGLSITIRSPVSTQDKAKRKKKKNPLLPAHSATKTNPSGRRSQYVINSLTSPLTLCQTRPALAAMTKHPNVSRSSLINHNLSAFADQAINNTCLTRDQIQKLKCPICQHPSGR